MNWRILTLGLIVAISVNVVPAKAVVQYTFTDLGTLPGGTSSAAYAINDNGQVVGYSDTASGYNHAYIWSQGLMTDIVPSGVSSAAEGINNNGQVVGRYNDSYSQGHAFLYGNGVLTTVAVPPEELWSEADGINDSGQIAGTYGTQQISFRAFLNTKGTAIDLGTLGGNLSVVRGINNAGQVVGVSALYNNGYPDNISHAFLYSNGVMKDLGTLAGPSNTGVDSEATAINDKGQVVGVSGTASNNAFLYSGGTMTDLGTLGGSGSTATGINESGQIVGWSMTTDDSAQHAYLYSGGTMIDLNSLIDPNSGWTLVWAHAINNSGQIVGEGTNESGETHGFLLTPVPEPSTFVLLGVSAFGLAWAWRRNRKAV